MSYSLTLDPDTIEPGGQATLTVQLVEQQGDEEFEIRLTRREDGEIVASGIITLHRPDQTVGLEDDDTDYYVSSDAGLIIQQVDATTFTVAAPED